MKTNEIITLQDVNPTKADIDMMRANGVAPFIFDQYLMCQMSYNAEDRMLENISTLIKFSKN